ncbi:MAG TPA: D-xylose ABC transporter ATP-binding protein [Clostridiales bacterium]|nr:D-xylose ABC transporter ATP-binding protein [Clostridiales bacterium]
MSQVILEMNNISKSFGGVHALKNVNFELRYGEVHCLIGENGAGKSTLMKILSGAINEYSGTLKLHGEVVKFADPLEAKMKKIATIYQERSLIPDLTGAQNIMIGQEPVNKLGIIDKNMLKLRAKSYLEQVSKDVELDVPVRNLSAAKQQLIEIAKGLSTNPDIIIMDEPTSSLTDAETKLLIRSTRALKEQGKSIIFISHKMEDIFSVSDRITILRDGEIVDTKNIDEITPTELIAKMVGRRIEKLFDYSENILGEEQLRVEHLTRKGKFEDVSFSIRAGEVLGISGLVGAGRSETAMCIFGYDKLDSGSVYVQGKQVNIHSPADAIKLGMALVPEDRKVQGLVQIMDIKGNLVLSVLDSLCKWGYILRDKRKAVIEEYADKLSIKMASVDQKVSSLSGGNQQKVVISKWLATQPKILILDEPTRGIDVGTKAEIYKLIGELSKQGLAIVLISSEMPEILGLCRRILVMRQGKIVAEMSREEATEEKILTHYLGER